MTELYNRSIIRKRIEKRLNGKKLSPNADLLIYLDFMVFIERLAKESEKRADFLKANTVNKKTISYVLEDVLRQFRG